MIYINKWREIKMDQLNIHNVTKIEIIDPNKELLVKDEISYTTEIRITRLNGTRMRFVLFNDEKTQIL